MAEGGQWFGEGAKRLARRELSATITFAILLGLAFAGFGQIADNTTTAIRVLSGPVGFALGWYLASRRRGGHAPAYLREFQRERKLNITNAGLYPSTPLLQQPFSSSMGMAFGDVGRGYEIQVSPFDYTRESRWHFEMLVRVAFRNFGSPETIKLVAATCGVGGSERFLPVMLCERRFGPGFLDSVDDAVRRLKHLEQESMRLDRSHEIFVLPEQDPLWPRRFLSPEFIRWQSEEGKDVSWELVQGNLVVTTTRRDDSVEELDRCLDALVYVKSRLDGALARSELAAADA